MDWVSSQVLNQLRSSELQSNSTSLNEYDQTSDVLTSSDVMSMYSSFNSTIHLDTFSYDLDNFPDELMPTTFDALNTSQYESKNDFTGDQYIFYDNPDELNNVASYHPGFYPIITTYTATFIIGFIGNVAVIRNWAEKKSLRSPTAFLVSLAVADLLMLIFYMPLKIVQYFVITWEHLGKICQISAYIEILSGTASVLNLVAVSVERFLVIVFPIKARSLCTISKKRRGLFGVWILALILSLPTLHTKGISGIRWKNNSTIVTTYKCEDVDDRLATIIAIYQLALMFILPGLFMIICYFVVIKVLWLSTKNIRNLTGNNSDRPSTVVTPAATTTVNNGDHIIVCSNANVIRTSIESDSGPTETFVSTLATPSEPRRSCLPSIGIRIRQITTPHQQSKDRKQVIKMLILVVILFLLCWGPRLIKNVIFNLSHSRSFSLFEQILFYSSELLPFVHSSLNPFVYGLMSRRFRNFIFRSCVGGNSSTEATVAIDSIALSSGVHSTRNGRARIH